MTDKTEAAKGKTHFADDDTLAHIAKLERELASQEVQMNAVRYRAEQAERELGEAKDDAAFMTEKYNDAAAAANKAERELASERAARMAAEGELNYLRRPLPADQNEQSYRLKMYSAIISLFRERRIAVEGPLVDYVQSQIERAEQAEQSLALERAARERAQACIRDFNSYFDDDNKSLLRDIQRKHADAIKEALAQEGGKPC